MDNVAPIFIDGKWEKIKTSEFGKEVDTVIIKNTGEPTYRLPDIAYHSNKIKREFDLIINILGADTKIQFPML